MRHFRRLFVVLCVVLALALPVLSFDFGITEDEQLHNQHGRSILDYFLGHGSAPVRDPIDSAGRLRFAYDEQMNDLSGALNIYGGVFDLLCAVTYRYLSPWGEFETRHLVNSLFGVLLIVCTGLTAGRVGGWRAAVIALLLMAASPRIIGHSMNNPVDLPFAAMYMFCIYFILRFVEGLPRPSRSSWLALLVGIPLAADIRIAGLVLIFYLLLAVCGWSLGQVVGKSVVGAEARRVFRTVGWTVLLAAACYLLVSVLWPFAHRNPLTTPLLALKHLSRLETFTAYDLFEGRWIQRWEIPWYFVPKWLLIGTPLFVPLGLALAPLIFVRRSLERSVEAPIQRLKLLFVAFAALFPVLFVILRESNVYNDARHVLFAYPPLAVVSALAFENALRLASGRYVRAGIALVLAFTLLEPLSFMLRNHPNQGVYFSPLIGGVDGAWRRYETDFWGNSVRQAVEWVQRHVPPQGARPVRIRLWFGDQTKMAYYAAKQPGYRPVIAREDSTDWDYDIVQTVACKYTPAVLAAWPPPGTVYEVLADDTPLTAVTVNLRTHAAAEVLPLVRGWAERRPTANHYYALGMMHYRYRAYADAASTFRRVVQLDPRHADGWNALGAAHGHMKQWDEEIEACRTALEIDARLELARNNLRLALVRRNEAAAGVADELGTAADVRTHDDWIRTGLDLQRSGKWAEALVAVRRALRHDPLSVVAYNNLCVAHNSMREWDAAEDACRMAVALDPDYGPARDNLDVASAGAGKP